MDATVFLLGLPDRSVQNKLAKDLTQDVDVDFT